MAALESVVLAGYQKHKTTNEYCLLGVQKLEGETGKLSSDKLRKGSLVKGESLTAGTVIASGWDAQGNYPNLASGNHVAVYHSQDKDGITVYDCWSNKPWSSRVIKFKGVNAGDASNNGDLFYVVKA